MNVNLNNLLISVNDNAAGNGTQGLDKSDNSFSTIMAARMNDGRIINKTATMDSANSTQNIKKIVVNSGLTNETENIDLNGKNIMELIFGIINGQILSEDTVVSKTDIINSLQNDIKENQTVNPTEIDYNNLMSMILDIPQNISYPNIETLSPKTLDYSIQNIQQGVNIGSLENFTNSKSFEKNTLVNSKVLTDSESIKNNTLVKLGSSVNQQNYEAIKNVSVTESKVLDMTKGTNKADSKIEPVNENILDEAKISKENSKDEFDLSRVEVENKKVEFLGSNKIIKISDESSEINNAVLSQVKDEIVIMSKDGTEHVNMELFPKDLGKIDIKMSFEKEQITVEIAASNKDTEKILTTHLDELVSILNKSNDTSVNVVVKTTGDQLNQYQQSNADLNYQNNDDGNRNNKYEYIYKNNKEVDDEDSMISEMINLRKLLLDKVV